MTTPIYRRRKSIAEMSISAALCVFGLVSWPLAAAPMELSIEATEPTPSVVTMAPIPDLIETTRFSAVETEPQSESDCLATAIYFEARGESTKGQKAVAEVVVTRAHMPGRPKTICGVVYEGSQRSAGCQFSFTCDRATDVVRDGTAWEHALHIAKTVMRTRGKVKPVAGGATNYHASYVTPRWASRMVKVAQIGTHIFYR